MKTYEGIAEVSNQVIIIVFSMAAIVAISMLAFSVWKLENANPKPMLCDETDEAVILKSEGWRARTAVDVPWIVDAAKKGWLEFQERPTLECYEPLHPDKRTVMNQFWWRAKVKKSGFPDVRQQELRPT